MSVINQVLNQLEQRGVQATAEQTTVRAVPPVRRKSAMPWLVLGLVLLIGFVAWQWMQKRKSEVAAMSAQYQPTVVAASAPVVTTPTPAVPLDEPQEPQEPQEPVVEMPLPASRLSFELSSVPLPSSLRELRNDAVLNRADEPAGNSAPPASRPAPRRGTPATKPVRDPASTSPAEDVTSHAEPALQPVPDTLPLKQISPEQQADAEFGKAVELMRQGHIADALAGYEVVLQLYPGHDAARQALVALLLEGKRGEEAERVLQDGLKVKPGHTGFAMLLARLQVERGAVELATATLEKNLAHAEQQADYQAFFAALLQRLERHKEAIAHYQIALQLVPDNGIWLMGYGISLQAVQRIDDARAAFGRALESGTLTPELQAFVQQKLNKEL